MRGIDNCSNAMPYYLNSYDNYQDAKSYFNDTKTFTNYKLYLDILDLYMRLTDSGSNLSKLRYNASLYLKYLNENITYDKFNNNATFMVNVSELMMLFDCTVESYNNELENYNGYQNEIDEYEFFDEIR